MGVSLSFVFLAHTIAPGADPGSSERGSEYRGASLMQGAARSYNQGRIRGGLWGLETPPPEIYQRSQKSDVLVLFLEISVISALYNKTIYIFQGVTPLLHIWLNASLYLLKYALCLTISMILMV